METVDVEGLAIAFERVGTGPPLVLLHGGLSDHREWRRQMEDLSDARTVVAWDAPGCGRSDDPPPTFRLPDYARTLALLLDLTGAGPAAIIGLSWGSSLAIELYRQRPDIPSALILAGPYAGWAGSLPPDVVEDRLQQGLRDLSRPPAELASDWLPTLLSEEAPAALKRELTRIIAGCRPTAAIPMLRSMAEADLRKVLPTIQVPTLLLCGGRDVRSSPAVAQAIHEAIPHSKLETLPNSSHQSNMETPGPFNDAVLRFLDDH
jgi:pimeloyl-ACP methyl ester carboxylesterase